MSFQIQVPSEFIRDKNFDSTSLYVYMKLIQRYYVYKKKYTTFEIDHKNFMFYTGIRSNKKFKDTLHFLYDRKLINNKIETLPRHNPLKIELNTFFNDNSKTYKFTQLPVEVLNKEILDDIGHVGVRLLFYFKSYTTNVNDFCYCGIDKITQEVDVSENTFIKYSNLLHKKKYIKKVKHKLETNDEYIVDEFGNEKIKFNKYNNHYHLKYENFSLRKK